MHVACAKVPEREEQRTPRRYSNSDGAAPRTRPEGLLVRVLRAAAVGCDALEQLFGPSLVVAAPSCEKRCGAVAVKARKPRFGV